jgi:hypothetical protein
MDGTPGWGTRRRPPPRRCHRRPSLLSAAQTIPAGEEHAPGTAACLAGRQASSIDGGPQINRTPGFARRLAGAPPRPGRLRHRPTVRPNQATVPFSSYRAARSLPSAKQIMRWRRARRPPGLVPKEATTAMVIMVTPAYVRDVD